MSDAIFSEAFHRSALQQFFKDSHPVSAQDSFDVVINKSALDQFAGKISGVRMVR